MIREAALNPDRATICLCTISSRDGVLACLNPPKTFLETKFRKYQIKRQTSNRVVLKHMKAAYNCIYILHLRRHPIQSIVSTNAVKHKYDECPAGTFTYPKMSMDLVTPTKFQLIITCVFQLAFELITVRSRCTPLII